MRGGYFDEAKGGVLRSRDGDRHGLGVTEEQAEKREWPGLSTPYEVAAQEASRAIRLHGDQLVLDLKPFNPNLAQTVVAGRRPRRTPEGQAARNERARERLPVLIAALRSPDDAPMDLFDGVTGHSSLAVALFALDAEDRARLADEYEAKLAEHSTGAAA